MLSTGLTSISSGTCWTSVSVRYSLIHGQALACCPADGSDLIGTVQILFTDDFDGSEAESTVRFGLDSAEVREGAGPFRPLLGVGHPGLGAASCRSRHLRVPHRDPGHVVYRHGARVTGQQVGRRRRWRAAPAPCTRSACPAPGFTPGSPPGTATRPATPRTARSSAADRRPVAPVPLQPHPRLGTHGL